MLNKSCYSCACFLKWSLQCQLFTVHHVESVPLLLYAAGSIRNPSSLRKQQNRRSRRQSHTERNSSYNSGKIWTLTKTSILSKLWRPCGEVKHNHNFTAADTYLDSLCSTRLALYSTTTLGMKVRREIEDF